MEAAIIYRPSPQDLVKQEVAIKEEISDEIDKKSTKNCDRIETEQVKSENMDFAEGVADYVKTEDLLIIETTEPKVETREDTADYESDATVNSDVILER
ncbi:unnamed protein product [Acanthoscelides obtectus]|nr:unnamed protein product [Acanthoscelides obtectus]CAK1626844.1 hypothetical protein AOBTE_LOCUS4109 [Acanthoscelides obtectus]